MSFAGLQPFTLIFKLVLKSLVLNSLPERIRKKIYIWKKYIYKFCREVTPNKLGSTFYTPLFTRSSTTLNCCLSFDWESCCLLTNLFHLCVFSNKTLLSFVLFSLCIFLVLTDWVIRINQSFLNLNLSVFCGSFYGFELQILSFVGKDQECFF